MAGLIGKMKENMKIGTREILRKDLQYRMKKTVSNIRLSLIPYNVCREK